VWVGSWFASRFGALQPSYIEGARDLASLVAPEISPLKRLRHIAYRRPKAAHLEPGLAFLWHLTSGYLLVPELLTSWRRSVAVGWLGCRAPEASRA
jgi:hypothetical protein